MGAGSLGYKHATLFIVFFFDQANELSFQVLFKAARSRINDADIAAESTELSKAQVLNQAAQAMLAQANKAQQSILQLLN